MVSNKTTKLVMAALMAALTCVSTMIIIFRYGSGGYLHLGDAMVLISGFLLGPLYGGAAAGIGSMLADLQVGAGEYAFATLVIKALVAITAGFIYQKLSQKNLWLSLILSGVLGGILVTGGYFLYEGFVFSWGGAYKNIPFNIIQNIFGLCISTALMPILKKSPVARQFLAKN